jgi:HECT-domain (ubiquitin-transferase)
MGRLCSRAFGCGWQVAVDSSNVREYVDAVVQATLVDGIRAQMTAFSEGFNEVRWLPFFNGALAPTHGGGCRRLVYPCASLFHGSSSDTSSPTKTAPACRVFACC